MNERALETHRLRRVGFVFQFFNLIPSITAFENIELPMVMAGTPEADCRRRSRELLGLVGLEAKGEKRPEELSGGEQQRVGVALALANDPALILADEPTGNLDSTNAAAIANLLKSLATEHGKTVIMVSHDPKTVEVFPTVYAMRDGRFLPSETAAGVASDDCRGRAACGRALSVRRGAALFAQSQSDSTSRSRRAPSRACSTSRTQDRRRTSRSC